MTIARSNTFSIIDDYLPVHQPDVSFPSTLEELQPYLAERFVPWNNTNPQIRGQTCLWHERSQCLLNAAMEAFGHQFGSVTYERMNPLLQLSGKEDLPLDPNIFFYAASTGAETDILRAGANQNFIHIFQIASLANATIAPGIETPAPGQVMQSSHEIATQKGVPIQSCLALRTNPCLFELINACLANGGYSMFAHILPQELLDTVQHGYFIPLVAQVQEAIKAFLNKGHLLEQPCLLSKLSNGFSVYFILSTTPRIEFSKDIWRAFNFHEGDLVYQLKYLVAQANYSVQFGKVLSLAQEHPHKTIVYHPCGAGYADLGYSSKAHSEAFRHVANKFQDACKKLNLSNIKVQLEVLQEIDAVDQSAQELAQSLGLEKRERVGELPPPPGYLDSCVIA